MFERTDTSAGSRLTTGANTEWRELRFVQCRTRTQPHREIGRPLDMRHSSTGHDPGLVDGK